MSEQAKNEDQQIIEKRVVRRGRSKLKALIEEEQEIELENNEIL